MKAKWVWLEDAPAQQFLNTFSKENTKIKKSGTFKSLKSSSSSSYASFDRYNAVTFEIRCTDKPNECHTQPSLVHAHLQLTYPRSLMISSTNFLVSATQKKPSMDTYAYTMQKHKSRVKITTDYRYLFTNHTKPK